MMQVFNNFPTSTTTPMFGWIIKHFQEGKQRLYLFIFHHGPTLRKQMEDEWKLNKFSLLSITTHATTYCITKSLPMDTYKHLLNTCWFIFFKNSLVATLAIVIVVFFKQHASTRNLILTPKVYHALQFYYRFYISLNAHSHQHLTQKVVCSPWFLEIIVHFIHFLHFLLYSRLASTLAKSRTTQLISIGLGFWLELALGVRGVK